MAHQVSIWLTRLAMAALCLLLVGLGYSWSDRNPPSYILAMWVIPDKLHIGEPVVVQEIFVRQTLCARLVQHGFVQNDENFPAGAFSILYPLKRGLIKQKFATIVPPGMMAGPALYTMILAWTCPWNPVSWVWPISVQLTYPVVIIDGEARADAQKGVNQIMFGVINEASPWRIGLQ